MNLPDARVSLVYSPLTKAEREELARTKQIQTVPLIAAKK
jgi:DNA-binding CsgD family transcriptional regulator